MVNFNAMHYLKHAWEATNCVWGKICIVLFYSFIWIQIFSAILSVFDPISGWDCLWENVKKSDYNTTVAMMRIVNLWILGFFLYADRGGIKFWNVFLVWIIYLAQWLIYKPAIEEFLSEYCPANLQQLDIAMWVTEIWIFLALMCAAIEASWSPGAGGGTAEAEETRPLL